MYNVYHGSWRDFTTAVGALFAPKWIQYLVQRLLNTVCTMYVRCMYARWRLVNDWRRLSRTLVRGRVIGELFEGNCWRGNVCGEICSVKRSVRFAHTAHASLMGAYAPKRSANRALSREGRGVLSGVNKLTAANLCDRKKRRCGRERYYDSSMSLRNSRFVLRRLYFVSPITPCPVW